MCFSKDYELLDFGDGRRLERFGEIVLDRRCPGAENFSPADPRLWQSAHAKYEAVNEQQGQWICCRELPDRWRIACGALRFELKRTPFGHVGLFPEHAENWGWISARAERGRGNGEGERMRVLNLFAYTGGSTLAAAMAGAEVVHVDAAQNIIAWARRNAKLSGLDKASIHWVCEDALKFVKRELRRGNRYDAVILDPPSYGHGRRGEVWRLSKHLARLLSICGELCAGRCRFLLPTCHTPGYDAARLSDMLKSAFPNLQQDKIEAQPLWLSTTDGRKLPSGAVVRWSMEKSR
ncbi:MAG: class I SAM-dependent methyltransferase [Thermoguttaceae bacterium]